MRKALITAGMGLVMVSQAFAVTPPGLTQAFNQLTAQVMTQQVTQQSAAQSLREEAIKRAAKVYGAQSGRTARWQQIESGLLKRSHLLAHVFHFGAMYLDQGLVQPPVLDSSRDVIQVANAGQARKRIHTVYRVLLHATFRQRPLTWQAFLLPDSLAKPTTPREALLPRTDQEKALWYDGLQQGWQQGVKEANSEFSARLDSLKQAYQGMALYTLLALRGMVAPPTLVITHQAVQRNANGQEMAVGVQQQVITQNSYFVAKPNHWRPVFYQQHFGKGA